MKYLSLFSGIGGFEYGIEQSRYADKLECIGFGEIDKYAKNIYKKHYPNHPDLGDVTKIRTEDLPNFDFLVGGFPCQAFSVAGKRRGFDDTRGTLFFEIARILRDKKPKYFLLENVKGLLSHDKGRTFQTILRTLSELGYDVQWEIFNSKNHGVPQNRERIYIKGFLTTRTGSGREVLSLRKANTTIKTRQGENTKIIKLGNLFEKGGQAGNVYSPKGVSTTLSANGGGMGGKTGLYAISKDNPSYEELKNKVLVRKYKVDVCNLRKCLHKHKKERGLSNKQISEKLNINKTEVDHWFRTDQYSSIPSPNIWYALKELLGINTDVFDESIMVFEIKDSTYDMGKKVYSIESISPTTLVSPPYIKTDDGNQEELKRNEPKLNIITNISANGKSARGNIYDGDGLCPTQTATQYKEPIKVLLRNNTKRGYQEASDGDGFVLGQYKCRGRVQQQSVPTLNTGDGSGVGVLIKDNTKQGFHMLDDGDGVSLANTTCKGKRTRKDSVGTLTAGGGCGNGVLEGHNIRRLTPVECERLQGFHDNWTQYGADGSLISDTQRYKCCGNAVTTNVVRDIMNTWDMELE